MKSTYLAVCAFGLAGLIAACSGPRDRYLDLRSGKAIELQRDELTGVMVNKLTGEPVYIYVDTKTNDTIYGKTGEVINGHVLMRGDEFWYDGDEKISMEKDGEVKYKYGDHKTKVEEDGDMKIKNGDRKVKIDGETGERKVKND